MRVGGTYFWAIFSLLALSSITLKTMTVQPPSEGDYTIRTILIDNQLVDVGFEFLGVVRPTVDGAFKARVYRRTDCPGRMIVMPLIRNSEGAHIAANGLNLHVTDSLFWMNGRVYHTFPTAGFVWAQIISNLNLWSGNAKPPFVYAIVETLSCIRAFQVFSGVKN